MASINNFEEIKAWQSAREFCQWVWKVITTTELKNYFKLRDQIDGPSGSIMDNIAEGFERSGKKEFIQHLTYAKGSAGETRSQLYRMYDRGFITENEFKDRKEQTLEISRMINGFIKYLKGSDYKGWRFYSPED